MDIQQFLQALPAAATSPFAFTAYIVLLGAWVVVFWLRGQAVRKTEQILKTYKNDAERTEALKNFLGTDPPDGLPKGQILDWVREQTRAKRQTYTLIAILALLLAVVVVAVVAMTKAGEGGTAEQLDQVQVRIRGAGPGGVDCLMLPAGARLTVTAEGAPPQPVSIEGCNAVVPWALGWRAYDMAHLAIEGAGSFERDKPNDRFRLGDARWEVTMRAGASAPRLLVNVYDYPSGGVLFDQFYFLVRNKIQVLVDSIASRCQPDCKYLGDLRIEKAGPEAASLNQKLAEWRSRNALLFLSGLFLRRDSADFVRTLPYFGELAPGDPALNGLVLELRVDAAELGRTTDTHSLALLYALALDAERTGRPREIILALLGQAASLAHDINDQLPGVVTLKTQLRKALERQGAPTPPSL